MQTILIIGSGGREHALAWALAQAPPVARIWVAPGNAGTTWASAPGRAAASNVALGVEDLDGLCQFASEQQVDLTVVGPEVPLALGIVDHFQAAGLRSFGPSQAASQLEASKVFAKNFMHNHGIPTAPFACFADYGAARQYLLDHNLTRIVIKADGLAAGKGVFVCDTQDEALAALHTLLVERAMGAAGDQVVIEQRISGPEVSLLAFCDGKSVVTMPPARDHKRIFDGDQGPNTGGMGAFAPAPDVAPALVAEIERTILQPAVAGMAAQGTPYVGVLYAGVMLTDAGPMALEFNCRFGDPETQVLLPLIANLLDLLVACTEGNLHETSLQQRPGACATVVLASPGYPGSYPTGLPIGGLEGLAGEADLMAFHAGTAVKDDEIVTAGGRVLAVSGLGVDLPSALARAYAGVAQVNFDGMHYRRDIGEAANRRVLYPDQ